MVKWDQLIDYKITKGQLSSVMHTSICEKQDKAKISECTHPKKNALN